MNIPHAKRRAWDALKAWRRHKTGSEMMPALGDPLLRFSLPGCRHRAGVISCGHQAGLGTQALPSQVIAAGFGAAYVTADGRQVIDGVRPRRGECSRDGFVRLNDVERWLRRERRAGRRYRVVRASVLCALWNARRSERGQARWICIESGEGFA